MTKCDWTWADDITRRAEVAAQSVTLPPTCEAHALLEIHLAHNYGILLTLADVRLFEQFEALGKVRAEADAKRVAQEEHCYADAGTAAMGGGHITPNEADALIKRLDVNSYEIFPRSARAREWFAVEYGPHQTTVGSFLFVELSPTESVELVTKIKKTGMFLQVTQT